MIAIGPEQGRPTWTKRLTGHVVAEPLHVSATSQELAAGRQTVSAGLTLSAGQLALEPVHLSAASQGPMEARQVVELDTKALVGHELLLPVLPLELADGELLGLCDGESRVIRAG